LQLFNFSASHYSLEKMTKKRHDRVPLESGRMYLYIDCLVAGTGSGGMGHGKP